jgi:hypothetical protein
MPSGILGQSNPVANTNTIVYTVPASLVASCTINIVNTGNTTATISFAISATGTPTTAEYLEFLTIIPPGGVLERGGLVAQAGRNFIVNCSTASLAVAIYGFEQ